MNERQQYTVELPYVPLNILFLGDVDGFKEASKRDLMSLFYEIDDIVEKITSSDYYYILGGKGSGKTYLAYYLKRLAEDCEDHHCEVIDTMGEFKLRDKIEMDISSTAITSDDLELFWEWIILLQIAEHLIADRSFRQKLKNRNLIRLNSFLKEIKDWTENTYKFLDVIIEEGVSSETGAQAAATGLKVKSKFGTFSNSKKQISRNNFYNLLPKLRKAVLDSIKGNERCITLCFDEIDNIENVNINDNIFYRKVVTGLINAALKINNNFITMDEDNIKVIVVIRSDIVDKLQSFSSNLNKICESTVELDWNSTRHSYEHPIMDLILTKIQSSNPDYSSFSKRELYFNMFDQSIMGMTPTDYLVSMGRGRPREVIRYLNIIKETYKDAPYFKEKYFRNTRQRYSKWLHREIRNEMALYFDGNYINEVFSFLKEFKKRSFFYDEIETYFNRNHAKYPNIGDLQQMIFTLYEFSVIGNRILKDSRIKNYRKPTDSDYEFTFAHNGGDCSLVDKIVVNRGLHYDLRLK